MMMMISRTSNKGSVPLILIVLTMAGTCQAFLSNTPTSDGVLYSRKTNSDLMATPQRNHDSNNNDDFISSWLTSGPRTAFAAILGMSLVLTPNVMGPNSSNNVAMASDGSSIIPSSSSSSVLLLASTTDTSSTTSLDFSLPSSYDTKMSGFGEGKEAFLDSSTNNNRESSSEKEKELIAMRKAEEARKEALAKKKAETKAREEETKRRAELKKKENADRLKNIFN